MGGWTLVLELAQNVSTIGLAAFLTTRLPAIKKALTNSHYRLREKLILVVVFGSFSAVGNWMGIPIFLGALANTRIVGPLAGGLLGGPIVGVGAGILGAIPRYYMGGFTVWASVISNILAGYLAGWVYNRYGPQRITLKIAAATAFAGEAILKLLVLTISQPFEAALRLEKLIALPTMTFNTLAVVFFVYIVHYIFRAQEKSQAASVQQTIRMLHSTSGFIQSGLTKETAGKVAQIIYHETGAAAIAITNTDQVLAFVGLGSDHHQTGMPIVTMATKMMLQTRSTVIINDRGDIGCPNPDCPLTAVIDVPLIVSNELVGSIKLFKTDKAVITPQEAELLQGIADFLSLQLAQQKLDEQQLLLLQIECQMLKAQINPHFFFNTLGTIQALIDVNPKEAGSLIKELAEFYRKNLKHSDESIALQEELASVRNYLRIEKVRFGDKIKVVESVPDELMQQLIPLFSLQLLVENAIRHGLGLKVEPGTIFIRAWQEGEVLLVQVEDNGVGMEPQQLSVLLENVPERQTHGTGIGLLNIHRRIQRFYGDNYGLQVESIKGTGTVVTLRLPIRRKEHA